MNCKRSRPGHIFDCLSAFMNLYSLPLHTSLTGDGLLPLEQPASTSMSSCQFIPHAGLCTMLCFKDLITQALAGQDRRCAQVP